MMIATVTLAILVVMATVPPNNGAVLPDRLADSPLQKFESEYPLGDARWCIERARQTKFELNRFEVLPGLGWDNLRNQEMAEVVTFNYTQCKVTDDGRLLIPDDVFTVPIKSSTVNAYAEIIDSWSNSSSMTSHTVNINANLPFHAVVASGSFSFEHSRLKTKQVEDNSVTARVQLRYSRYQAYLQPDPQLTPAFKSRLLDMAASIQLNRLEQARYDAQILVRDFGTHYLTSVTAGAALVKDDYLKTHYVTSSDESKTSITASAGLSFFHTFGVSVKYGYTSDTKVSKSYNDSVTHSFVTSHGGPLLRADPDTEKWIDGVDVNLVPLDREGEPLSFLITERLLPELPTPTIVQLEKIVRESIMLYYEMNTIRGCTKMGTPNFSFSANFDDGSCKKPFTNMTFGGVYQTCTSAGRWEQTSPCTGMSSVNPLTGDSSCPPHYKSIKLHTGEKQYSENKHSCHRCWIFGHCCHDEQLRSTATYTAYWCAAEENVPQASGYMFGGLYTKASSNLVTGDRSCPPGFYPRPLFTDLQVCLSDDFELYAGQAVPFGGFFSCQAGNPLASGPIKPVSLQGSQSEKATRPKLAVFMTSSVEGPAASQTCPTGYSQHMATSTVSGCAIHYCVRSGFLSGPLTPPVKRPPFTEVPMAPVEEDNLLMFDVTSETWLKNEKARDYQKVLMTKLNVATPQEAELKLKGGNSSGGMSAGTAAGVSVAATLVCVALATAVIAAVYRRRTSRQRPYSRLVEQSCDGYGTSGLISSGNADRSSVIQGQ